MVRRPCEPVEPLPWLRSQRTSVRWPGRASPFRDCL